MKVRSGVGDKISIRKKSKKKKTKKKLKMKKSGFKLLKKESLPAPEKITETTLSFCSFDNVSVINESGSQIILTPSKSEHENKHHTIPEFEENDISCVLNEDGFETSVTESESYTYNSIIDEFVDDSIQEDEAKIVSLSTEKINGHTSLEEPFELFVENEKETINRKAESLSDNEDYIWNKNVVEESSDTTVQYYYTNDGVVILLEKNDILYFHGLMSLSILHGEVEVLGYKLSKDCQDMKLYSLRSASLLSLKNVTTSNIPVTHYLLDLNLLSRVSLSENCAIVLCKKLENVSISFIEKHISQQILPKMDNQSNNTSLPRVVFQPRGNWNLFNANEEWNSVIDTIDKATKMLICGGKGVGKSTFLRYAVNRLLMTFIEVRIVDLDPGQPEFTIPGCISVIKVKEPLFGPNYTHLKEPERSILSNINVGYEPEKYIESVKRLLETDLDQEIPTLINYMGFTHGIGINILSAVIIDVQPTDIVQINSQNSRKNYKEQLTKDVILTNCELFVQPVSVNLNYRLHLLSSMCDENDGWTAEARQLREMNILGYISQMIESNSIFNAKAPMYRIDLGKINIFDLNGKVIHPAAVNASLVALCSSVEDAANIFQCHGWGIVRGIDMASNMLVLLTLEEVSVLENVTSLVLNSAPLPPSVFMTPDEVVGPMPYVMEGVLMSFGQIPKRSRISARSKE